MGVGEVGHTIKAEIDVGLAAWIHCRAKPLLVVPAVDPAG